MSFSRMSKKDLVELLEHLMKIQTRLLEDKQCYVFNRAPPKAQSITLKRCGDKKLRVIKAIRQYNSLSQRAAFDLVSNHLPYVFSYPEDQQDCIARFHKDLVNAGADTEINY
jgi:ribosomal protein L7/L12